MQSLRKALFVGVVAVLLAGCASNFTGYRTDIFRGKEQLTRKEFGEARDRFVHASGLLKDPEAFAFAATVSYKLGDMDATERYIRDAEQAGAVRSFSYFRVVAYKALVLFRTGKDQEAYAVLKGYTEAYNRSFGYSTVFEVELMWQKRQVDLALLERLLDEQVAAYESEIDQFQSTMTGYYDRNSGSSWY